MLRLVNLAGNSNVGVFAHATETHLFVAAQLPAKQRAELAQALGVTPVPITLGGTSLVGSLVAANRNGVVVAGIATPTELKVLRGLDLRVDVLEDPLNAAGNNLLATDAGALCNPAYPPAQVRRFEEALGVPVQPGTVAGLGTVGMAAVATAGGVLVHPKATVEEREVARRVFQREVMSGTINHGTGLIGAGLVANTRGALIGDASTSIEIARIEDALGFLPTPPATR